MKAESVLILRYLPARPDQSFASVVVCRVFVQLLLESDTALSVLRGRSLLVHLIHSLPTPAIAAAGGPGGLLNITRLLAAHDLANGIAPTSVGTLAEMTDGDDRNDSEPPPRPSVVGAAEGEADHLPGTDSKLLDFPQLQRKSLLKVKSYANVLRTAVHPSSSSILSLAL